MNNYIFLILMGLFFSALTHAGELEVSWVYEPEDIAYNPDLSWAGGYVDPIVSSPILDERSLYFSTYSGSLFSLDAEKGEVKWHADLFDSASWGSAYNELYIFFGEGLENERRIVAVDKNNGHVVWQYQYPNQYQLSYPVEYNGLLLFVSNDYIFCLNAENGTLFWKYAIHGMKGQPVVSDGVVYYQDDRQSLYAVDIETGRSFFNAIHDDKGFNADGMEVVGLGSVAVLENSLYLTVKGADVNKVVSYDKKTSELLWQHELDGTVLSDVAVSGDFVYLSVEGDDSNHVVALDRYDGHQIWAHELKAASRRKFNFDDHYMYFGAGKGVYVLDKLTGREVASRFFDQPMYTEARVDGEMIFIGTFEGEVYALKLLSP
ncbi:hypothetical protein BFW38_13665 [Terasakiispira papahanaumokuakeensis]|uniref:Pyrrolo-quinoline quinone repeat domain-containing protein n=1 Tax=Terasakiispira papahanaumokuakeensis TaxID=197479 RepID=A0A1E2VBU4_9GAMM|nr:PQQ-binding-like beta-propeller repeat protein [Terasakiispira papahanaumokuakeensis]ODC04424.1 hypothetical protein BFW38_13665 [Terasakiispira papahanaumokuakeensis]